MKVTAIPFFIGTIPLAYISGDYGFIIATGLIMSILVVTKQVKLI